MGKIWIKGKEIVEKRQRRRDVKGRMKENGGKLKEKKYQKKGMKIKKNCTNRIGVKLYLNFYVSQFSNSSIRYCSSFTGNWEGTRDEYKFEILQFLWQHVPFTTATIITAPTTTMEQTTTTT